MDERNYRHSSILYFYVTWRDPTAYATVVNSTARMLAGEAVCATPCSDYVREQSCCDGIFLPSFTFR